MNLRIALTLVFILVIPNICLLFVPFKSRIRVSPWTVFLVILLAIFGAVFITWLFYHPGHPLYFYLSLFPAGYCILFFLLCFYCIQEKFSINLFAFCIILNYSSYLILVAKTINIFIDHFTSINTYPPSEMAMALAPVAIIGYPFMHAFIARILKPIIDSTSSMHFWRYMWVVPFAFYCIFNLSIYPAYGDSLSANPSKLLGLTLIWIIGTGLSYFITLRSISEMHSNSHLMGELEIKTFQSSQHEKQYERIKKSIEETRAIRHDLKHHFMAIKGYADKGDTDGLMAYLDRYLENIEATESGVLCENYAVNTILNHYTALARDQEIAVTLKVGLPAVLPVDEPDVCVTIGNLFDNALEACLRLKEGVPREITVTLGLAGKHMIIVIVKNNFNGSIQRSGDQFISSKRSGEGIGIASVKNIAQKNDGVADFTYTDTTFTASVLLKPDGDLKRKKKRRS